MSEVKFYDPNLKPGILLTPAAIAHVKKEVQKHEAQGFRVGVKKGGCSGLKYIMDYVYEPTAEDEVFLMDDLKVFVDKDSLPVLSGVSLDYVKEGLNGSLKFINPNEKGSCGCGVSFTV